MYLKKFPVSWAASSPVLSQVKSEEVKTQRLTDRIMIQPDCYKLLVSVDTNQMLVRSEFLSLFNSLEHNFRINTRGIFSHMSLPLHQLNRLFIVQSTGKCQLYSIVWKLGWRRGKKTTGKYSSQKSIFACHLIWYSGLPLSTIDQLIILRRSEKNLALFGIVR